MTTMIYPTDEQLNRVQRAAMELEESMRACEGVKFEIRYGDVARYVSTDSQVFRVVPDAVTVYCTHQRRVSL